ncbi:MAG: riboflavin synthase [Acidimicrobiales bacterium]
MTEALGALRGRQGPRHSFSGTDSWDDLRIGQSVAVNGCCLTVVEVGPGWCGADLVEETLRRTNLGDLALGDRVNLERAIGAQGRLEGHIVTGHVEATAVVVARGPDLCVELGAGLERYVVPKGSIALDGVSLTVVTVDSNRVSVALIPHTLAVTTLGRCRPGDRVNIETDVLARHVERLIQRYQATPDQARLDQAKADPPTTDRSEP